MHREYEEAQRKRKREREREKHSYYYVRISTIIMRVKVERKLNHMKHSLRSSVFIFYFIFSLHLHVASGTRFYFRKISRVGWVGNFFLYLLTLYNTGAKNKKEKVFPFLAVFLIANKKKKKKERKE